MTATTERVGQAAATPALRQRRESRESGMLRCQCGNILGHTAGRYTVMRWRRRSYLLLDVRHVVCEECGHSFTPDRCTIHAPLNIQALKANTEVLRCQTPDCCGIPLGNVREGTAIVDAAGRIVVASAIVYTDCSKCRVGIDLSGPVVLAAGGSGSLPPMSPPSLLSSLAVGDSATVGGVLAQ